MSGKQGVNFLTEEFFRPPQIPKRIRPGKTPVNGIQRTDEFGPGCFGLLRQPAIISSPEE